MNDPRVDGRRESGDRTRARLLEATKTLVAERGESNVSLRDIAEAAQANIAAVSYHFGSKDNLCRAAIEDAITTIGLEHLRSISSLPGNASIEEISSAMVATIVAHMSSKDKRDRAMLQITARAILSGSAHTSYARVSKDVFDQICSRLRVAMPKVKAQELQFRADAAATLLHAAAAGTLQARVTALKPSELARWLVSVVSGCLRG